MTLAPPATGTPITYEDVNQLLTAWGIAILLVTLFIFIPWIVGEERKAARVQKRKAQPTERQEK